MEKKINLIDVIIVFIILLACFTFTVTLIMNYSADDKSSVYQIIVSDDTAEIIKQGDILYDTSENKIGKVISIGSVGRQKTIDVKADRSVHFRIGEYIELRTQRIFLKGTVYSVKKTEEKINEE